MTEKTIVLNERTIALVTAFCVQITQRDALGTPHHIMLPKGLLMKLTKDSGALDLLPQDDLHKELVRRGGCGV